MQSSGQNRGGSAILLSPSDNVAIATCDLPAGTEVMVAEMKVAIRSSVPAGHKFAVQEIPSDSPVLKYGCPIGLSTQSIKVGDHVHLHNLADHHIVSNDLSVVAPPNAPVPIKRAFNGFHRPGGQVGTRNYVAILSTVNCSASVCQRVASRFTADRLKRWPNVDGVFAATHTTGCAMQWNGLKQQMLGRVLSGYAQHANVGAALVLGLGCEQTTSGYLSTHHNVIGLYSPDGTQLTRDDGIPMVTMQTEGGTRATIAKAESLVEDLLDRANQFTRQPADASHLNLAVECGGSDGYSGITANPAVGIVSDRLVACGGTSVISETTELYGAEHLLIQRSRSAAVAQKLLDRIDWWKEYVAMYDGQIDNNPSVGNKAGGLTTITEKSLGAVSKSGSTTLEDVYLYADPITAKGLVVMDSPGFDPSSVTGKVAGGANLVMFTTGRGSCFGCKPTPVIKVATNTPMYNKMTDDMDLNAGTILDGESVQAVGDEFFEFALKVASGLQTRSEQLDMGDHEFVPWTVGPVL